MIEDINILADFCAQRDIEALTREAASAAAGGRVDVAILFGGSILAGGDLFARAVRDDVADRFMIVGGQGHSTDALRAGTGWADVADRTEAELFDRCLRERYGIRVDLLEHESTNCGNNISNALALLAARGVPHDRILIVQDATMQRRMGAGFRLLAPAVRVVNFASHRTHVALIGGAIGYPDPPTGMWTVDRYVAMLMGEIPRLTDDRDGYGPAGRGFIAHVDIPPAVTRAYEALRSAGAATPRAADPRWA